METVAFLCPDRKNVPYGRVFIICFRQNDLRICDIFAIIRRDFAPAGVVCVQMKQLYVQHRRLQFVQTAVRSLVDVVILAVGTVIRQSLDFFEEFLVVRHDRAAVAHAPEVLPRIERKRARVRQVADALSLIERAVRLRAVLKHFQAVFLRDVPYLLHLNGLAVQVNDHDRFCFRRDRRFNFIGIDVVGADVRFDQNRRASVFGNRQNRRDIGVRRHNDLVAGTETARPDDQVQRIQSVRDADISCRSIQQSALKTSRFPRLANTIPCPEYGQSGRQSPNGSGCLFSINQEMESLFSPSEIGEREDVKKCISFIFSVF